MFKMIVLGSFLCLSVIGLMFVAWYFGKSRGVLMRQYKKDEKFYCVIIRNKMTQLYCVPEWFYESAKREKGYRIYIANRWKVEDDT